MAFETFPIPRDVRKRVDRAPEADPISSSSLVFRKSTSFLYPVRTSVFTSLSSAATVGGTPRSRSTLFAAVCVARRLITLPAHVSLSGSICPHNIKPFATREFCNSPRPRDSFPFWFLAYENFTSVDRLGEIGRDISVIFL